MAGRPRKPLSQQTSHLKIVEIQQKQEEEALIRTSDSQLKTPPAYLRDEVAKREWRRQIKNLKEIGIVGNLDRQNLIGYCNAYSGYVEATRALQGAPLTIETVASRIPNPLIKVQTNYAAEMRHFEEKCGLDLSSRLKAATGKAQEKRDKVEAKFGAI